MKEQLKKGDRCLYGGETVEVMQCRPDGLIAIHCNGSLLYALGFVRLSI